MPKVPPGFTFELVKPGFFAALRLGTGLPAWHLLWLTLWSFVTRSHYSIGLVRDASGTCVYHSVITARDFRYPFMSPMDLMIGSIWTEPQHRSRGIASAAVGETLSQTCPPGEQRSAWYVVAEDNVPSIRVALINNFRHAGIGRRVNRWGSRVFGWFRMDSKLTDYASITEKWGMEMPDIQLAMAVCRYDLAASRSEGKRYLEIGCGTGFGLPIVANVAALTVGGDITESNLVQGKSEVPMLNMVRFDAHRLPFKERSFDRLALFEVLYYFEDVKRALAEARRILTSDGELLLCLPNRERPGFHPSAFSVRYYSAHELHGLLRDAGFDADIFGGFAIGRKPRDRAFVLAAALARTFHMIPSSLEGRGRIKKLLYPDLKPMTGLDDVRVEIPELERIDPGTRTSRHKNLYVVARRIAG